MAQKKYLYETFLDSLLKDRYRLISLLVMYIIAFSIFTLEKGIFNAIWITAFPIALGLNYMLINDFSLIIKNNWYMERSGLLFFITNISVNLFLVYSFNSNWKIYLMIWVIPLITVTAIKLYLLKTNN